MTMADLSLVVFAACNVLHIAAYIPQSSKLARHPGAAASFSYATWALFTAANPSTAVYAGWCWATRRSAACTRSARCAAARWSGSPCGVAVARWPSAL
jgi:hypothetical protein